MKKRISEKRKHFIVSFLWGFLFLSFGFFSLKNINISFSHSGQKHRPAQSSNKMMVKNSSHNKNSKRNSVEHRLEKSTEKNVRKGEKEGDQKKQVLRKGVQKFVVDAAHSSVEFSVKHLGIIPVKGHFNRFQGEFKYDVEKAIAYDVSIQIDVDSIDTNEDDRDAHLRGEDFFHVRDASYNLIEKNRYIVFMMDKITLSQRKIRRKKEDKIKLKGILKILNTSRKISLTGKARFIHDGKEMLKIAVELSGKLNRHEYGINWQKPSAGVFQKVAGKFVGDWVYISVHALFQPEKT